MSSALTPRLPINFVLPVILLLLTLASFLYLKIHYSTQETLSTYYAERYGSEVSESLIREAILSSAQKLTLGLDIDLENSDISLSDYQALVEEAAEKFGKCQQYRLLVLQAGNFSCFTCTSKSTVFLLPEQTFKIGQTCGDEKSRYGSILPEPGLKFYKELEGNVFEMLVAEYIKLKLFRYSPERKSILEQNNLEDWEMLLPPGNKQTR